MIKPTFRKAWAEYQLLRASGHRGSVDRSDDSDRSRSIAVRLFKTERTDYARRHFAEPSAFKCHGCASVVMSAEPVGWLRSRIQGVVRAFCPTCPVVQVPDLFDRSGRIGYS